MKVVEREPRLLRVFGKVGQMRVDRLPVAVEGGKPRRTPFEERVERLFKPRVVRAVRKEKVHARHLVDIGGNTGRFTKLFLETHPNARATFVDLPAQIENLARHAELECVRERIDTVAIDWLTDAPLTGTEEADLYWMSQFLDCFSLDEARSILVRTARAMKPGAKLAVLEPLVDEQRHEAAALSLAATSLYFTVMANGNSRFFHGGELRRLFMESGLRIVSETPNLGISHTLFILEKESK